MMSLHWQGAAADFCVHEIEETHRGGPISGSLSRSSGRTLSETLIHRPTVALSTVHTMYTVEEKEVLVHAVESRYIPHPASR